MASSSSNQPRNHNVFVSFREVDMLNISGSHHFVKNLCTTLKNQGICTYKDHEVIREGESICPNHLKAIRESRISVVVLSRSYADSPWCLDELTYIIKCMDERGQIVIPIFYKVIPEMVRTQLGVYEKAFGKHEVKNKNKVEAWRKSLEIVGASNPAQCIANFREASNCIKQVVDSISNTLFPHKGLSRLQDVEHLKIPLQKLSLATNNFSEEYLITNGGFGKVYKAHYEHCIVALKKLDPRFGQGEPEFMMEIALLSAYTHKNLVCLVGFCDQDGEKILVYKYESNGSLDQHLQRKDLTWIQCLRICLDVARGLQYLHDEVGTQHRILHRDIKSSNILLDENFNAKITDFGLSKIALANVPCTLLISRVCGTPGYCDPEYYKHGILTQKSDVYSFGVVLFEVLCGKLVGVSKHLDEHFSADLAKNHYEKGTLDEIIDTNIRNQMNSASFTTFSTIAHQCLMSPGQERPKMSVVVKQLEEALTHQQVVSP